MQLKAYNWTLRSEYEIRWSLDHTSKPRPAKIPGLFRFECYDIGKSAGALSLIS
jgi:hypothetical protein